MSKKVLIAACEFPPVVASGMYHPYYLAKYLRQRGWEPFVLTGRADEPHDLDDPLDMADHLDADHVVRAGLADEETLVRFVRREIGEPDLVSRLLRHRQPADAPFAYGFPDRMVRWLPGAHREAARLVSENRFDAVVTTSFPFSSVLLGRLLQRAHGLPWVAEFRDLWTEDPRFPAADAAFLDDSRRLEREALEAADRVVGVSEPLTARLRARLGKDAEKFRTIELSYEDAEFPVERAPPGERFRVLHAGTVYPGMMPASLVKAVDLLRAFGKIDRNRLELVVAGADLSGRAGYLESLGLRVTGPLRRREMLSQYGRASLLLLTLPEGLKEFIPSRIFEYMASGVPVLGVLPADSVAAALIRRSRAGTVVDAHADVDVLANSLYDAYSRWQAGALRADPDWGFIRSFGSRAMAGRWAELLDSLKDAKT